MKNNTIEHIGFIMDGNRRWAKSHLFSLFAGHSKGAENIEPIVDYAKQQKIPYLTFWAFSTENWRRANDEVTILLDVMRNQLKGPMIMRLKRNHVKVVVIGDISKFPQDIQNEITDLMEDTKNNESITVNVALNYGGRSEIVQAVNKIIKRNETQVTEETFSHYLYTKNLPDPDLIIRTGGEQRLSGFLPWQIVYSELYFTQTLWPDFNPTEFEKALAEYKKRQRRFGR